MAAGYTPLYNGVTVDIEHYHKDITCWYVTHGRKNLPWRLTDNPYHIWVSEVMLQQTQVQTVLDTYYHPFLTRFPTITALANASEEEVLKCWQGLGYYSRARNLHKAAQRTAPTLPDTLQALQALPGIGKNTAHAIMTFAYHAPVPVMETNVKRVLHRLLAAPSLTEKECWDEAYKRVDTQDPFTYNQAMMDIGATICTAVAPKCLLCPIAAHCKGKNDPLAYPAKKAKKATPVRQRIIIMFEHNNTYYAAPRTSRFLGGLYGFAEYMHDETIMFQGDTIDIQACAALGHVRQQYSHFTLQADVYRMRVVHDESTNWHDLGTLHTLPLSRADQKILALLEQK